MARLYTLLSLSFNKSKNGRCLYIHSPHLSCMKAKWVSCMVSWHTHSPVWKQSGRLYGVFTYTLSLSLLYESKMGKLYDVLTYTFSCMKAKWEVVCCLYIHILLYESKVGGCMLSLHTRCMVVCFLLRTVHLLFKTFQCFPFVKIPACFNIGAEALQRYKL